jgi:hypothetical protein
MNNEPPDLFGHAAAPIDPTEYIVYHDESKEPGYWHIFPFVPVGSRAMLVTALREALVSAGHEAKTRTALLAWSLSGPPPACACPHADRGTAAGLGAGTRLLRSRRVSRGQGRGTNLLRRCSDVGEVARRTIVGNLHSTRGAKRRGVILPMLGRLRRPGFQGLEAGTDTLHSRSGLLIVALKPGSDIGKEVIPEK